MSNPPYLQRHHNTWVLTIKVPKDMVVHEGKRWIRKSLQTGDVRTAKQLRDIEHGRFRERWRRLREAPPDDPSNLEWVQFGSADLVAQVRDGTMDIEEARTAVQELIDAHLAQFPQGSDEPYPDLPEDHVQKLGDAIKAVTSPDEISLSEAVKTYLEETKERVTTKTYNEKKRFLDMLVESHGPSRSIRTLNRDHARSFIRNKVMKLSASATTRKKVFSIVNAFGQWAEDAGMIDNPFVGMGRTIKGSTRGVRSENQRRPWTTDELLDLFKFEGVPERFWKVWYGCALLLLTGARRGEILNARADAIVHDGTGLEVAEAKNTESLRVIPLHPLAQRLVARLRERSDDGYLLPGYPVGGQNEDDRGNAFLKQFSRVRKLTTGIGPRQGLDIHSFRHTFETTAANAGIDQRIVNEITGHAHDQGTGQRVYLHGIEFDRCYKALKRLSFGEKVHRLLRRPPV